MNEELLHIELEIYYDINDDKDVLLQNISDIIVDNETEFYKRMHKICIQYNDRANFLEESLEVQDINLENSEGIVEVSYDFDAYHGCKDIDQGDTVTDEWSFKLIGKSIIFDIKIPDLEREDEI